MIYRWSGNDATAGYLGVTDFDERKMQWYDPLMGDPLTSKEQWESPLLRQYLGQGTNRKRKLKPIGDAPTSAMVNLVSQRAADELSDIWERHALLYPVLLEDAPGSPYYMVVVRTELPFSALDRSRSTGKPVKYGDKANMGFLAPIETWCFDDALVGDNDLFVLPDSNTSYFVSQRFKERIVKAALKRFCLRTQFWDSEPWLS